jgi:hemerythrin
VAAASKTGAVTRFEWDSGFLVGVREIDEQHRRLVEMVAHFYDALAERHPARQALAELLKGLVDYTGYHFSTEERLMAAWQFPQSAAHRAQHAAFVQRVTDIVDRFSHGGLVLSIEATGFLREWLTGHILGSDKELGRHLQSKGVS